MKYAALIFLLLLVAATPLAASTIFVAPAAPANASGQSWSDPVDLQTALQRAKTGDEVWVRVGVYTPGQQRNSSFVVPAGVRVYGGFGGHETSPEQRSITAPSVLSGNIGNKDSMDDNVYTVVRLRSRDHHYSTLDGFVIRDGAARGFTDGFAAQNAGGGLYIEPLNGGKAAHQISNCVFVANRAHNGGAVFVSSGQPVFTDCRFQNNTADFNGGAIYNQGAGAYVSTTFQSCHFEGNSSNSGGCMTNNATNGQSTILILSSYFVDNHTVINGGVVYNITRGTGDAEVIEEGNFFSGNSSLIGSDDNGIESDGITRSIATQQRRHGGGTLRPVRVKK